ncbi:uncharacterized protein LOC135931223 isoform X1 [Gordionus sp. m RMFG-2023]|uniref:uncharacterized protein LOC135931223 isoform X1 n=1 Tax=Gordionus sp. m RMFG-2023 TaxID=3053472 RepID=UPI0031FC3985
MDATKDYLRRNHIRVTGIDSFSPIFSLDDAPFDSRILEIMKAQSIISPTPIQSICWPIALEGRDMVGIAQTGSGKTLAFMLPALMYILKQPSPGVGDGPICLVMCPTRELAQQVQQIASTFGSPLNIHNACIYGGSTQKKQTMELHNSPHIVIATPGRLITLLESCETSLNLCSFLILDEADRMLDLGFEPQIKKIMEYIMPNRRTLMFSATWPTEVHSLASDMLNDYVKVVIGEKELTANKNICQIIHMCQHWEKQNLMFSLISDIINKNQTYKLLIFVRTKKKCNIMNNILTKKGWSVCCIHGDKQQLDREQVLNDFKNGTTPIMVATSVASRGLDVEDINVVINFDFPDTMEDYVHRIGRTARSTKSGTAHSYFTPKNYQMAFSLLDMLKSSGQEVPHRLYSIASRYGGQIKRDDRDWNSKGRRPSEDSHERVKDRRVKSGREESDDSSTSDINESGHQVKVSLSTKQPREVATSTKQPQECPPIVPIHDPLVEAMKLQLQQQQTMIYTSEASATTPSAGNAYDTYLALQASQLFKQQNPELFKKNDDKRDTKDRDDRGAKWNKSKSPKRRRNSKSPKKSRWDSKSPKRLIRDSKSGERRLERNAASRDEDNNRHRSDRTRTRSHDRSINSSRRREYRDDDRYRNRDRSYRDRDISRTNEDLNSSRRGDERRRDRRRNSQSRSRDRRDDRYNENRRHDDRITRGQGREERRDRIDQKTSRPSSFYKEQQMPQQSQELTNFQALNASNMAMVNNLMSMISGVNSYDKNIQSNLLTNNTGNVDPSSNLMMNMMLAAMKTCNNPNNNQSLQVSNLNNSSYLNDVNRNNVGSVLYGDCSAIANQNFQLSPNDISKMNNDLFSYKNENYQQYSTFVPEASSNFESNCDQNYNNKSNGSYTDRNQNIPAPPLNDYRDSHRKDFNNRYQENNFINRR